MAEKRISTEEAAAIIGCSLSHTRHLCRISKLDCETRITNNRIVYRISLSSAKKYRKRKPSTGFPRGKKRTGSRGKREVNQK